MTNPIPLLEPVVLNEVVRDLRPAENLILSNRLPRVPTTNSYYRWDILRNSRTMAQFNVPDAEANVVQQHGRRQGQASLAYTREKKTFSPTTTEWIRAVGTTDAIANAEQLILGEIQDLSNRVDVLTEYVCWQALGNGKVSINQENVNVDVDYQYDASNFAHPAVSWATATPSQIVADLEVWIRNAQRRNRVQLTEAWTTSATLARIFQAFAVNAENGGLLLTDVMRAAYFSSGMRQLPGFMGITWNVVEGQYDLSYDAQAGDYQMFLPDDKIIFTNLNDGQPMKIVEGPTADFGNQQGAIGKFMKTWEQEDPSARWALFESRWLPVITRPDRVLVIPNVTATS